MLYVCSSPLLLVDSILTWRWPSTAETCRHRRTNKLCYLESCVLTNLPTLITIHLLLKSASLQVPFYAIILPENVYSNNYNQDSKYMRKGSVFLNVVLRRTVNSWKGECPYLSNTFRVIKISINITTIRRIATKLWCINLEQFVWSYTLVQRRTRPTVWSITLFHYYWTSNRTASFSESFCVWHLNTLWIYTLSNSDLTLFSVNCVCLEEVCNTVSLCQLWCVSGFF